METTKNLQELINSYNLPQEFYTDFDSLIKKHKLQFGDFLHLISIISNSLLIECINRCQYYNLPTDEEVSQSNNN